MAWYDNLFDESLLASLTTSADPDAELERRLAQMEQQNRRLEADQVNLKAQLVDALKENLALTAEEKTSETDAQDSEKVAALMAPFKLRLETLLAEKNRAIAANMFVNVMSLENQQRCIEDKISRLEALPCLRADLRTAQAAENWSKCITFDSRVQRILRGHAGDWTNGCDGLCDHGVHQVEGVHLSCCASTRFDLGQDCRLIQVGDTVQVGTTLGLVLAIKDQPSKTPYFVLTADGASWTHQVRRTKPAPLLAFAAHSGGYRVPLDDEVVLELRAGQPPASWKMTRDKSVCNRHCAHVFFAPRGLESAHWACCCQPGVAAKCEPVAVPDIAAGNVVVVGHDIGVVTRVNSRDLVTPYRVEFLAGCKIQNVGRNRVRRAANYHARVMAKIQQAGHTGEFRAKTVLFSMLPDEDLVDFNLRYSCSRPEEDEEDGSPCTHGLEGQIVVPLDVPHWSGCGCSLFAECKE